MAAIVSAGVTAGESTAKPFFQAGGGFRLGRHFAGIGSGLDLYRFRSIPVFADWRYNLGKMRAVFVYAHAGFNIPYGNDKNDNWLAEFKTTDKFTGGPYADAGIGYRVKLGSMHGLLFSGGYSHKRINHSIGYTWPCLVEPCPEELDKYEYNLGRIMVRLSWEFRR